MKYYLIAGEKSGDLHASNLMKELKKLDENAEFRCWGGDEMKKEGGVIVKHYKEMAFMGFLEVILNLTTIIGFLKKCKKDILNYKPDVVILVDYAGFNLRIAGFTKKHGFKTFYYISPKVWAWNQKRALKIKKVVDRMFVIMHFEKAFYKKYDFDVDYVGNPLFDSISKFEPNATFLEENGLKNKPLIAVLPGSRKQEVLNMSKTIIEIVDSYPEYEFIVAGVDNIPNHLYDDVKEKGLKIIYNQTYDLLNNSYAAIVTSGTATLETALFNVPQVVCYKTSFVSYKIAKALIKVKFISLVNLIADKEIVKELIQKDFNPDSLKKELSKVLKESREEMLHNYKEMRLKIETEGTSKRTAGLMTKYLTR